MFDFDINLDTRIYKWVGNTVMLFIQHCSGMLPDLIHRIYTTCLGTRACARTDKLSRSNYELYYSFYCLLCFFDIN